MKTTTLYAIAVFATFSLFSCSSDSESTSDTGADTTQTEPSLTETTDTENEVLTSEDNIDTAPKLEVIVGNWKSDEGEKLSITSDKKITVEKGGEKTETTFEMYDKCAKDGGKAEAGGNFLVFKKGDVDCCYEIVFEGGGDLEMRIYEGEDSREAMFSKQ